MSRKEALQSLLAKVEAGASGSVMICAISDAFGPFGPPESGVPWLSFNAFHGSLGAAKALHDAVPTPGAVMTAEEMDAVLFHPMGARFWLAWKIRHLISQEETA